MVSDDAHLPSLIPHSGSARLVDPCLHVLLAFFQIRFILLQNRQGKTRLSKWYVPAPSEQEKFRIESEIHKLIVSRDRKYTNFVEVRLRIPSR